jgi:hypothetical protein
MKPSILRKWEDMLFDIGEKCVSLTLCILNFSKYLSWQVDATEDVAQHRKLANTCEI